MVNRQASRSRSHCLVFNRLHRKTVALTSCALEKSPGLTDPWIKTFNDIPRSAAAECWYWPVLCLLTFLENIRGGLQSAEVLYLLLNLDFSLLKPKFSVVWGQSARKRNTVQYASGYSLALNSVCIAAFVNLRKPGDSLVHHVSIQTTNIMARLFRLLTGVTALLSGVSATPKPPANDPTSMLPIDQE